MTEEPNIVRDEELARQAQAGSLPEFEELVRRFEGRIYRFVANSCRHETDAREVTQEAFVTAYQKLAQFDPARSFAGWLFTIARRKCIDHHRVRREVTMEQLPEGVDADDPAALLARRETQAGIWEQARRVLPDTQFEALWLRYVEDLSLEETARVMRRTQTHVKVLLFRARGKLERAWQTMETPGIDDTKTVAEVKPASAALRWAGVK